MAVRRLRVGVLFGGRSGEHEVSLVSARSVMGALDRERYEAVPIGIDRDGRWSAGPRVLDYLQGTEAGDAGAGTVGFSSALLPQGADIGRLDVVFPVLHGPMGEDGTIQGLLELARLPYVGSGVAASAAAMDKAIAKDLFKAHGLPIVAHRVVLRSAVEHDPGAVLSELEAALSYPMFVKPANLGSSVGISKAADRRELRAGLEEAARFDRKLVVKQGVAAREIEVSVLGNDDPSASVPGEVVPSREFYSYEAKYVDDASDLIIPAALSDGQTQRVRATAIEAYRALDCAGLARVDFLIEKDSDAVYLSEVNTMPGFTAISMYPKLWEASGLAYPELLDRLIDLALERHAQSRRNQTSYQPAAGP